MAEIYKPFGSKPANLKESFKIFWKYVKLKNGVLYCMGHTTIGGHWASKFL